MGFLPCGCGKPFPSSRLSRLKLANAEGRTVCASAIAAAKSVSFSDPLMSPSDFELIFAERFILCFSAVVAAVLLLIKY